MSDATDILSAIDRGEPRAAEHLLPLVYDELRRLAAQRLARETPGQSLQATALVHEAYLRLVGDGAERDWASRGHFFAAAAEAMRRIILDRARNRRRHKRSGTWRRWRIDQVDISLDDSPDNLLALDDALESLAREDPASADLVKLRFFAGLTLDEAASALGIARRTADRVWAFARSWLFDRLRDDDEVPAG